LGPRRSTNFTNGDVIVFDPLENKLFKDSVVNVASDHQYTRVPIKGTSTKVDIVVGPEATKMFLAAVDLSRLGRRVKKERKNGKITEIFVLGQIPE